MKKRILITLSTLFTAIALSLLMFFPQQQAAAAADTCDCSWGYQQVHINAWHWLNDTQSKYCDCGHTPEFDIDGENTEECDCGQSGSFD